MDVEISRPYERPIRLLGSAVLLAFYFPNAIAVNQTSAYFYMGILLLYLALIWIPASKAHAVWYISATCATIVMVLILRFGLQANDPSILWPLYCILPSLPKPHYRLGMILALPVAVVILLLSLSHGFPIGLVLGLFGLFAGIRARRIRMEAARTRDMHLNALQQAHAKLQQAHAELQAAALDSMRYAALEERTRLSREIHDGLGHQLTGLIVGLQAVQLMLPSHPNQATDAVDGLVALARKAMSEVRIAVREWANDEMGLGLVALRGLVSQVQSRSRFRIRVKEQGDFSEWGMETSIVLYRVLQESLTNVMRHADASAVDVEIVETAGHIRLAVTDNGSATTADAISPGFGLNNMRERAEELHGTCTITTVAPHGLSIEVTLPLQELEDGA